MEQQELGIQDGSNDRRYFTLIPNYILNHSTLWDREVYIQMKKIAGENGTCWTSQKALAKQSGISINRLKKSIEYLLNHKWIKFVGAKTVNTNGGIQKVNEYRITDLWKINVDYYESKGVSPNDTPISKGVSRTEPKGYHENDKGVSPSDDKEEPFNNNPIKEDNAKALVKPTYGNPEINEVIDFLKAKLGVSLDGPAAENRRYAHLLIGKLRKDYPESPPAENVMTLITAGLKDAFHSKNMTNFKYLYYNCNKIVLSDSSKNIKPLVGRVR